MDWGLGNPNKTAALIACLMVGLWILAYFQKWAFWMALIGFTGLGICLVHTFSRGGFVALVVGLVPVLWMAPRPWPWKQIAGVVAAVGVIMGFSIYLHAHERVAQGLVQEDRSVTNRLDLWSYAPTMMLDAPGGWGIGNSGKAFMEWYQPLDRNETYRTMVSSHLTWLVEFGWPGRLLYFSGWMAIFAICLPSSRWLAVPCGVWLAFLVSAAFSSVAEEQWLWIVPGLFLLGALSWRLRTSVWPAPVAWLALPVTALLALLAVTFTSQNSEIRKEGSKTFMGEGKPTVWVVMDESVLGSSSGKLLRRYQKESAGLCIGIVRDLQDLPDVSGTMVILTGQFAAEPAEADFTRLAEADSILLVNPSVFRQEVSGIVHKRLVIVVGDFAQSAAADSWMPGNRSLSLPGTGVFVPDWPTKLLNITR